IYPNPIKDIVNINFSNLRTDFTLIITDNLGKEFYKSKINKGANNLKLNITLNPGLYVLSFVSDDKITIMRKKIIVIK
ncbi:MAG: T9SS type A sorting domain-containing protein, partial [Bacteroidales bacterium]